MGSVALDANVVIGFVEPTDALHPLAIAALGPWLAPDHRRLMPMSVYSEVLVHPLRRSSAQVIDRFVEGARIELVALDRPLARLAADLRARVDGLDLGDAMVLATAVRSGAELLTFDERLKRMAAELD